MPTVNNNLPTDVSALLVNAINAPSEAAEDSYLSLLLSSLISPPPLLMTMMTHRADAFFIVSSHFFIANNY